MVMFMKYGIKMKTRFSNAVWVDKDDMNVYLLDTEEDMSGRFSTQALIGCESLALIGYPMTLCENLSKL